MELNNICTLIKKEYVQNGLKEIENITQKQVFCSIKSVSQKEFSIARTNGFKAEKTVTVATSEYDEEVEVMVNTRKYKIYRIYRIDENFTQLYCESI